MCLLLSPTHFLVTPDWWNPGDWLYPLVFYDDPVVPHCVTMVPYTGGYSADLTVEPSQTDTPSLYGDDRIDDEMLFRSRLLTLHYWVVF